MQNREVHLVARPHGEPKPSDFAVVSAEIPTSEPGQFIVKNSFMSVDPYMRGRMNDVKSYVPPFRLNEAMTGGAVGTVVESTVAAVPVGATVLHMKGWQEYATLAEGEGQIVDSSGVPEQAFLGVLGMPGITAYAGLLEVGGFKPGDTVFVSGAAGAVGSLVGQFAKLLGAGRVIGSAGGPEKTKRLLTEFGFDAAIDYRAGNVRAQLAEAAPDGIDLYFDNVGGEHLEAALDALRVFGRVVLCGAISQYNSTEPPAGPRNLNLVIGKRLTMRGMLAQDHGAMIPQLIAQAGPWLRSGELRAEETIVDGIEHAADAFMGMMRGANTGKMLVRL